MAPASIDDLEQVVNFRDVGRAINEYTGER
jgi:hypothetical protein